MHDPVVLKQILNLLRVSDLLLHTIEVMQLGKNEESAKVIRQSLDSAQATIEKSLQELEEIVESKKRS